MIGQQANQLVSRVEEGGESETGRCQKCVLVILTLVTFSVSMWGDGSLPTFFTENTIYRGTGQL